MKGSCETCQEKQRIKGFEDYCCVLCALGLSPRDTRVSKDEAGTIHIDLSGGR